MVVYVLILAVRVIVDLSAFLFAILGEEFICNRYEVIVTNKPVVTTLLVHSVC